MVPSQEVGTLTKDSKMIEISHKMIKVIPSHIIISIAFFLRIICIISPLQAFKNSKLKIVLAELLITLVPHDCGII